MLFQKIDSRPEVMWRATPPDPLYIDEERTSLVMQVVRRLFHWLFLPHQWMGSVLFPACYKDRYQVLRFVENWELPRALMRSWMFSIGALDSVSQLRAPALSGWRSVVLGPLLQGIGKRDLHAGQQWHRERFSVLAPHGKIDAFFLAKRHADSSNRVLLYCCSQDELAEGKLYDQEILTLADKTHSSIILWNLPGVGGSEGPLERSVMVRACRAMVRCAESSHQEMIAYGHSRGADILLESLVEEPLKARSLVVLRGASLAQPGRFARFFGWGFNNGRAVEKIQAPVMLLHTACVERYTPLKASEQLIPDTVIEDPHTTLAHTFLERGQPVMGIPFWHDEELDSSTITPLAHDISCALNTIEDT
jgi:hypothetical protein